MKYAKGVTLTEDERRMVGLRDPFIGGGQTASGIVRTHACAVTLPTGQSCSVGYARISAELHRFDFAAPLCQTVWHSGRVINGYAAIESQSAGSDGAGVPTGSGSGAQTRCSGPSRRREKAKACRRR